MKEKGEIMEILNRLNIIPNNKIGMNFIIQDENIIFQTNICQPAELFLCPNTADRVVRTAKDAELHTVP